MRGPFASLATADVLEDRTLVLRPEDAGVRRELAAYLGAADHTGGAHVVWNTTEEHPRRPVLVVIPSTFASNALAAGVTVFELARIMGTSVR